MSCEVGKYIPIVLYRTEAEERRHQKPPYGFFMDSQTAPERGGSNSFQHHQNLRKWWKIPFRLTLVLRFEFKGSGRDQNL